MKNWVWLFLAGLLAAPWFLAFLSHAHLFPVWQAVISGLAILSAAFLLSWGAEVAQIEIPRSLAVAFVAIVAVIPEYAVDITLAAKAGRDPSYVPFAVANMTGANRLIIGAAWALVVLFWWARSRKKFVEIEKGHGLEFSLLFLVTIYSFVIPLKRTLSMVDGLVLTGFFLYYMWRASRGPVEEPEIEGPAVAIALLPRSRRRMAIAFLFLFSLAAIITAAEPFVEGLIATGRILHVEEFLLIQILAPVASEAPEFIVAGILALKGNPSLGMGSLLSSKLNQWTLLVGMIPLVYLVSRLTGGHPAGPVPLDGRQIEEIFLTSAQSLFAVAILSDFRFSLTEAGVLFSLYVTQYFFTDPQIRWFYGAAYLGLALVALFIKAGSVKARLSFLKGKD